MNIIIGVSTYGSLPRVNGFIKSVMSNLEDLGPHNKITFVCYDDGTPDNQAVNDRKEFCKRYGFKYVRNAKNMGIPFTWNRIAEYEEADLVGIFNDDARFLSPGWMTRVLHFYERNQDVGTLGLPLVNEMGFNSNEERWTGNPGRVGCAVGCAFFVRPSDLFSIVNPDGSKGYWEDLWSFHEELQVGFKLAEMGKLSYMLPWPPLQHFGGATFGANHELIWRPATDYFTHEEFLDYARNCPFYVPQYEEYYAKNQYDRMTASRLQFAKYWGIYQSERHSLVKGEMVDNWAEPQKIVHEKCVSIHPPRKIYWLDREGIEKSYIDA